MQLGCTRVSSLSLTYLYVEVRIYRSISESPLEFEITRVDCICLRWRANCLPVENLHELSKPAFATVSSCEAVVLLLIALCVALWLLSVGSLFMSPNLWGGGHIDLGCGSLWFKHILFPKYNDYTYINDIYTNERTRTEA